MSIIRLPVQYTNYYIHTLSQTLKMEPTFQHISREQLIELFNIDNRDEILKLIHICSTCPPSTRCTKCKINFHTNKSYYISHLINYGVINTDIEFLKSILMRHNNSKFPWNHATISNILSSSNSDIYELFFREKCDMIDIRQFFHIAIDTNNIRALKLLLDYGYELMNIHQIIFSGHIELIQYAESLGHDLQHICNSYDFAYNSDNWIYSGVDELKVLIELNIDLSTQINNIMLHRGVYGNNLDVIKFCIDLEATNLDECLDEACMENLSDIIIYLLDIGADATSISECAILYLEYDVILSLLKYGYVFSIDELHHVFIKEFTDGDDLNKLIPVFNIIGSLDFLFVIENKYIVKSNCFISSNGDINSRSMDEYNKPSNLEWIVSKNKFTHVKFIVEHAFDKLQLELNRLFIIAIANGHVDMMLYLLDLGADIKCNNNLAIPTAIFFGHYPMLKILLEYGMKLDDSKHNLLMMCAYGSSVQEYKIIGYEILTTELNIFRNDQFNYGLHYADIFNFLMENNVIVPDHTFIEVLDKQYYSINLFTYVMQNSIDINSKLNVINSRAINNASQAGVINKQSPYYLKYLLERAIIADSLDIIELLLENGACYNGLILTTKNEQILNVLRIYGADI